MKVKRVALISFHTCPLTVLGEGKAGGMNVYVRELSRHMERMGIEVDIFTRCHPEPHLDKNSKNGGIHVIHLDGGPLTAKVDDLYGYLHSFLQTLYCHVQQQGVHYQVVHSHYWLSGWVGSQAALEWGVPHVMTFHTLAQLKSQARAGEGEAPLRSETERRLMSRSHLVTASSPHEKQAMVRLYGAPEEKIQIVPCGVDLSMFRPLDVENARRRLGLNGERVILFVGRIEPLKGVDLLVDATAAMESRDSLKVLIVGGDLAGDPQIERLQGQAREMGMEGVMAFVGKVEQSLLPIYYSAANVCVVPSYYESFGLVALEAMACGTPVVASRVGGLPTVIQHGRTGYLMPWHCPEPLADSLEVILSSTPLQRSMGLAARRRAEGMGWEQVAGKIVAFYEDLAAGDGPTLDKE